MYTELFTCENCGKMKYRNHSWSYRRMDIHKGKNGRMVYFCCYSCMTAWDKTHEYKKGRRTK